MAGGLSRVPPGPKASSCDLLCGNDAAIDDHDASDGAADASDEFNDLCLIGGRDRKAPDGRGAGNKGVEAAPDRLGARKDFTSYMLFT